MSHASHSAKTVHQPIVDMQTEARDNPCTGELILQHKDRDLQKRSLASISDAASSRILQRIVRIVPCGQVVIEAQCDGAPTDPRLRRRVSGR
jgi:hypothetical protein